MSARQRNVGVVFAYINIFVNLSIALVFTPVFIGYLGQADYGLFVLAASFAAYLAIFDMGLSDASVRYLVRYRTQNDQKGQENYLANLFVIYCAIAVLILFAGVSFFLSLDNWFQSSFSRDELETLRKSYLVVLARILVTVLTNPISALLVSYERFVFLRAGDLVVKLISTLSILISLMLGYQVFVVVLVSSVISASYSLSKWVYALLLIKVKVRMHSFEWRNILMIFQYAAPIFVVVLVEQIYWKLDNVLIAAWLGTSAVAVYAIGITFHKFFMSFSTSISNVLVPHLIRQIEEGREGLRLTRILVRVGRMQAAVLGLLLLGLIFFGQQFLILWVGWEFLDAYWVMTLTVCPLFFELTSNLRNIVLQVRQLYWWKAATQLFFAGLNIVLTVVFVRRYGVLGAAFATGICLFSSYCVVGYLCQRKADIQLSGFLSGLARGLLPLFIISGIVARLLNFFNPVNSWSDLIGSIFSFSALYLVLLYFVGLVPSERILLRRKMRKINNNSRLRFA